MTPIKLTSIEYPDLKDVEDKRQPVYLDPADISFITRGRGSFQKEVLMSQHEATHFPRVDCTVVNFKNGQSVCVIESVDHVGKLWAKAMKGKK